MNDRRRIVVALDLSEYAEIVLEHALDQAVRSDGPDLHFVAVVEHEREVDETKRRLAALVLPSLEDARCTDWRMRLHVRVGKAPEEITALADEIRANLIVIGRFGTHHPRRRLGTVASRVIDLAGCPTLVVGLTSQDETVAQCPECIEVRASSDGEQWFCEQHRAPDRVRLTAVISPTMIRTGGGPMW